MPERILIVGPSWVGDMVMAQSLFRELVRRSPGALIDVLAPAWSRPIVAAMPEVRASIDMPVGHGSLQWGLRRELGRSLRGNYDWAIVLPNSFKSALIPWFARIPRRTGWRGEMRYGLLNDLRVLDREAMPLMVQRFAALACPKGQEKDAEVPPPSLVVANSLLERVRSRFELPPARSDVPVLGLCPGAEFGAAKQWPEQHYAEVAAAHLQNGGVIWLFGSEKDAAVCESIQDLAMARLDGEGQEYHKHIRSYAGKTSLEEALALIAMTDAVVSNDSGLMHVAAGLNKPLVAVYGSTSPGFTPPLSTGSRTVRTGIECSPCFERTCPLGHYKCLRELAPSRVQEALGEVSPFPVISRSSPLLAPAEANCATAGQCAGSDTSGSREDGR